MFQLYRAYAARELCKVTQPGFLTWRVGVLLLSVIPVACAVADAEELDFNRDVRPILATHCYNCHGPDEDSREADLRLDTYEGALQDLGGYAAVSPGHPDESTLIERIQEEDESIRMPPEGKEPLTAEQIATLEAWIKQGAKYEKYWSYAPVQSPELPKPHFPEWANNDIDLFILARLEAAGLTPAPRADRYALIRRLSLDLTGLPPTIEEADAFVKDTRPDAYERLVDHLLASPHFGERWAQWWLDLARFADSHGYESDEPREMSLYRDWVIRAFNSNMPFDKFTIDQNAGDLRKKPTTDELVATGFHRNTPINKEGGAKDDEFKDAAIKDRVETTFAVWMGATFTCSRCHTHKYDPLLQSDYYSVYSIFNNTTDSGIKPDSKGKMAQWSDQPDRWEELKSKLARADQLVDNEDARRGAGLDARTAKRRLEDAKQELAQFEKVHVRHTMVMQEGKPKQAHIHKRGDFLSLGKAVEPDVPASFNVPIKPLANNGKVDRMALSRWLLHRDNPRTSRVTVNRVWDEIFGSGIVKTSEEFGVQGDQPSHPLLLDWLAADFMDNGWDFKRLVKQQVMSATYQQAAVTTKKKSQVDPDNRLLSRGARYRVTAEAIRDISLHASGLLSTRIGGPSVFPPQPDFVLANVFKEGGFKTWPESKGADRYRRGVYVHVKRTALYPLLRNFDGGSRSVCLVRRSRSNTPLHSLQTLNDPAFVEAAGAFAQRMMNQEGSVEDKIRYGYRLCATQIPDEKALAPFVKLHQSVLASYTANPKQAAQLVAIAFLVPPKIDQDQHPTWATWVIVANTLLNTDAALCK